MKPGTPIPDFTGFKPEFFRFFRELKANNNRDWFMHNKARYQEKVLMPLLAFTSAMQAPLAEIAPRYRAIPKVAGGSIFRIYRDARYSRDGRPYKENAALHFRHEQGRDAHAPGYYLHLEPGRVWFGGGIWLPPAPQLAAIRRTIMDSPAAWSAVINDPAIRAMGGVQGKGLKTAPRGIDREHPMIGDLRRKSFFVMREVRPQLAGQADFVTTVAATFEQIEPLMDFICHALDLPF